MILMSRQMIRFAHGIDSSVGVCDFCPKGPLRALSGSQTTLVIEAREGQSCDRNDIRRIARTG